MSLLFSAKQSLNFLKLFLIFRQFDDLELFLLIFFFKVFILKFSITSVLKILSFSLVNCSSFWFNFEEFYLLLPLLQQTEIVFSNEEIFRDKSSSFETTSLFWFRADSNHLFSHCSGYIFFELTKEKLIPESQQQQYFCSFFNF